MGCDTVNVFDNRYHNDQPDHYQISGSTDCIQKWYPGEMYRDSFGIAA